MSTNNKTAEIIDYIKKKGVVTQTELATTPRLLKLFSNTTSTTPRRRVVDTAALLAKRGYLSVGTLDGEKVYKTTEKAEELLKSNTILEGNIDTSRFDGNWYFVTFEIPESQKTVRNQVILSLKRHGFVNYSKGLWVLPYNPINLIEAIRKKFKLNGNIKLIIARALDNEKSLRKKFNLN